MPPPHMVQQVSELFYPLRNLTGITAGAQLIPLAIRLVTYLQGLRRELGREDTEAADSQFRPLQITEPDG